MRVVLQRVSAGSVTIRNEKIATIGQGLVVFFAVAREDTEEDAVWLAKKTVNLRIFPDGEGKMNLSLLDINGQALIVSQFTLYADCEKGLRPSFIRSAPPDVAKDLYEKYILLVKEQGIEVKSGVFQADMLVEIKNDGPVTVIIDSKTKKKGNEDENQK